MLKDRIKLVKGDITNAIADIERQGGELPPNPDCIIFESELIKKALVLQAEKDATANGGREDDKHQSRALEPPKHPPVSGGGHRRFPRLARGLDRWVWRRQGLGW